MFEFCEQCSHYHYEDEVCVPEDTACGYYDCCSISDFSLYRRPTLIDPVQVTMKDGSTFVGVLGEVDALTYVISGTKIRRQDTTEIIKL